MAVGSFVKVAAAAFTMVMAGAAAPVFAQDFNQKTAEVRFADLDLTNDADVVQLQQRIKRASRKVCGNAESRTLDETMDMMNCRQTAMSTARSSLDLAVAAARNGERYAAAGGARTLSVSAP